MIVKEGEMMAILSSHYGCDESMQMFLESDLHRLFDPNPIIRLESPNYTCMHGCVDAPEVYVALAKSECPASLESNREFRYVDM